MDNYFIILDLFLIFCLFLTMIVAMFRGFKKSLIRFLSLLAASILLFIFINPFTNYIKDVKIDLSIIERVVDLPDELVEEKQSMSSIVNYGVGELLYQGDEDMKEDSQTATFILSISTMIIKIIVYISSLGLVWILQLIFRLILRIILGKQKRAKPLLGVAVGFAHYILIFILIFLPLLGTTSLISQIITDVDTYVNEIDEGAVDLSEITYYTNQYENTITKKIIFKPITKLFCKNKEISFDAQYVGNALSFKVDDTKVKFIDEYILVKDAVPSIIKVVSVINEFNNQESQVIDLSKISDEEIQNVSNLLRNSKLIRTVIPVAMEIAIYNLQENSTDYAEILVSLSELNWDNELTSIADLIDVLQEHNDLQITLGDLNAIITSNGVINLVEDFSSQAFNLSFITDIALPVAVMSIEEDFANNEFAEYEIDFSLLKDINWKTDGPTLISSLLNIYRSYLSLDTKDLDIKILLDNEKLPEFINTLFDELNKSIIVTDKVLPIVMQCLVAKLETNEELKDFNINFNDFKNINWKDNLPSIKQVLVDVVNAYQTLDVDLDNIKPILRNTLLQQELDQVVNSILNCQIVTDYFLPTVMNKLIDKVADESFVQDFDIDFETLKLTDWKSELRVLTDVLIELLNVYQQSNFRRKNWTKIIDDPNLNKYINDVVEVSMKSTVLKEQILPCLANKVSAYIDSNELSMDISFVKDLITKDTIIDLLNNDVDNIVNILRNLKAMDILENDGSFSLTNSNHQKQFIDMIKTIFNLSIIEGKEEQILKSIMNITKLEETLQNVNITLDYKNVTNWDQEIGVICNIFESIMGLTDDITNIDFSTLLKISETEEDKIKLAELIEQIGSSKLIGNSIYDLIEFTVKEVSPDYSIIISNESKDFIENVTGWKQETLHLLNLFDRIESISADENYKELDADQIKEIMLYCAECEITTLVFGTVLNEIFKDVVDHDFTKREVLKADAEIVYNTIKLANIVSEPTFDLNDKEATKDLVDTITNLAQNEQSLELTNQLLGNIIDETSDVNYTKEDIEEAASVVNDIIESYQNSENQDEFDLSNLSQEDLEKVENSKLGKLILGFFFKEKE